MEEQPPSSSREIPPALRPVPGSGPAPGIGGDPAVGPGAPSLNIRDNPAREIYGYEVSDGPYGYLAAESDPPQPACGERAATPSLRVVGGTDGPKPEEDTV
jgi:hypothetical protein